MGLLRRIRESYAQAKAVARRTRTELETAMWYQKMTCSEAAELPDDLLWECVTFRLERAGGEKLLREQPFGPCQAVCTVRWFDLEMRNGGLRRYFSNSSRVSAPYLEQALTLLEAEPYRNLLLVFLTARGIDVLDLSGYDSLSEEELDSFDEFDNAYRALREKDSLDGYCVRFVRAHLDIFFEN